MPKCYLGSKTSNYVSSIQKSPTEEVLKEPSENQSIWGTFHFIAKSDNDMQAKAVGARTMSPVVDPNMIPQEVLEDIYGGELQLKYILDYPSLNRESLTRLNK